MKSLLSRLFSRKKEGFYFIHIPKTAGTSFITLLDACVKNKEIFPCQLWHEINEEIIQKKGKYKLLRGHFGGGSWKLLCKNTPYRLTILRHPTSLTISTFHFIKREKKTAVYDLVHDRNMNLHDFLQEPLTAHKINNRMVRHLSFDLHEDPEAQELFLSTESVKVVSKWIKPTKKITQSKRFSRAIQALEECSWFGLQEHFDRSMQLFAFTFKRPPIGKSPLLNAYKPQQKIDNPCQNLINSHNEFDLKLYHWAETEFEKRYQQMCDFLGRNDPENRQSLDELIDAHYQAHHKAKISYTSKIHYDFSQELLGSGWHRRELTQPENNHFRWTSNENSFLDFWLEHCDYNLQIRIINAVSDAHLQELDIKINGSSIDYSYDLDVGVVRILSANIPNRLINNSLLRIQLKHPKTCSHSEIFNSHDDRYLGIAVNWIKLEACQKNRQKN